MPEVTGRSAAVSFIEEHEHLQRELAVAADDLAAYKEQLMEHINMVQLLRKANEDLSEQLATERARGNTWLGYTMKLSGQMQTIKASIEHAQTIAQEAAQSAAERGLASVKDDPKDQQQLRAVVNQMRPRADLPDVRP